MHAVQVSIRDEPLPLPNPQDWCDTDQACVTIGVTRQGIYDMVNRGVLTRYYIGVRPVFWKAECADIAKSVRRLRGHRRP